MEETLTPLTLGLGNALYRTLRSTNQIENLNGSVADYTKNVRRWRGGSTILRWVGRPPSRRASASARSEAIATSASSS